MPLSIAERSGVIREHWPMTWDEQDRTDHTPRRWAIAVGHTPRGGVRWRVIEETDRFLIVEIDADEIPMI